MVHTCPGPLLLRRASSESPLGLRSGPLPDVGRASPNLPLERRLYSSSLSGLETRGVKECERIGQADGTRSARRFVPPFHLSFGGALTTPPRTDGIRVRATNDVF